MIKNAVLLISALLTCHAKLTWASDVTEALSPEDMSNLASAEIVLLGERHDNADHHRAQTELVELLSPTAVVFEMLTEQQAAEVTDENRLSEADLEKALGWNNSGWPDFSMYYPIFAAAPDAAIFGAQLERQASRAAMQDGVETVFGAQAEAFGLTQPLPKDQQEARERLQAVAHCNKLPADVLPRMVMVQRLRDAHLARVTLQALADTGGPVVVITGNGHARTDWGIPVNLHTANADVSVIALGQGEKNSPPVGEFDMTLTAPAPEREDPCAAFN
ncbi:ChaN family lipoprotein [Roseovarius phycicola]|uniref:ChaN family lipoprotein n=1 Tax=Roseovarius phycicola TaxID=3080976 RepID=A0ABZ2HEQ0_9RHOB